MTRMVKSVPSEKILGPAAKEPNGPMFPKGNLPNCNGGQGQGCCRIGNLCRFSICAWFGPRCGHGKKISKRIPKEFVVRVLQNLGG